MKERRDKAKDHRTPKKEIAHFHQHEEVFFFTNRSQVLERKHLEICILSKSIFEFWNHIKFVMHPYGCDLRKSDESLHLFYVFENFYSRWMIKIRVPFIINSSYYHNLILDMVVLHVGWEAYIWSSVYSNLL